jgi:hypothetical protein
MKLSEFIDATQYHSPDAEIVIAGGHAVMLGIKENHLAPSDFKPEMAKVWSMADTTDAVVLEL